MAGREIQGLGGVYWLVLVVALSLAVVDVWNYGSCAGWCPWDSGSELEG